MASQSAPPATNERIVRLLEEVKTQLADSKKREQQIAKDLTRLLVGSRRVDSHADSWGGWVDGVGE
jgi:hypothetical protein